MITISIGWIIVIALASLIVGMIFGIKLSGRSQIHVMGGNKDN